MTEDELRIKAITLALSRNMHFWQVEDAIVYIFTLFWFRSEQEVIPVAIFYIITDSLWNELSAWNTEIHENWISED